MNKTTNILIKKITLFLGLLLLLGSPLSQAAQTITYYHLDALGSPIAASDEAGNVLWREQYRPYGKKLLNEANAQANTRGYTGHPHDEDTQLTYMGARYYDPIGRFMAIDPQGFNEGNPQSFNRYAYANNNPYRFTDPDGESPLDIIFFGIDAYNLGAAVVNGQGVGQAAIDLGISAIGLASPIPGIGLAIKAGRGVKRIGGVTNKGLGNSFKGRTPQQIDKMFKKKGFKTSGDDPVGGLGGYVNPKTGRSYHIDPKSKAWKKGTENPHVDVNRPKGYRGSLEKKKYPLGDTLYEQR